MFIYLIRHGQKNPHAGDPGLTDIGIKQAQQTGRYLQQFPIDEIVSSPFKRTVETAEHIANELGLTYSISDALIERMNWDDEGVGRNEFLREWIKATHERHYVPKFGDSSYSTGKRIEEMVESIAKPGKHVVLVTHGGAILDYLRNIFGDEELSQLQTQYEEGADYQMLNCSVNKVSLGKPPQIELLNFSDHLDEASE